MGRPYEKRNRVLGTRGRRTNDSTTGFSSQDSEFTDLGHSVPWSSWGSFQHKPRIT